jgi:hypothetical protein
MVVARVKGDDESSERKNEDARLVREKCGQRSGKCANKVDRAETFKIADGREETEEKEEETEQVGPGADPGYGLGVDREAQPEESCGGRGKGGDAKAPQEREEQDSVEDVEEEIGEMKAGRTECP